MHQLLLNSTLGQLAAQETYAEDAEKYSEFALSACQDMRMMPSPGWLMCWISRKV